MRDQQRDVATNMLLGALAGAVGTLAMGRVSTALHNRQGRLVTWREKWARGGSNTHTIAARKIARLVGAELDDERAEAAGTAMHYGVGTGTGALFGAVRHRIPAPAPIRGLAFGALVWLIADEVGNVAAGLTPGPRAFPWQTHARGLAAHLTFGLVTEGVLSAADWARARRHPEALEPVEMA